MSDDIDKLRERIDAKYREIQNANFYEILGVDEEADRSEISNRFRKLAKKWHADRFSNHDLGDEHREKLQEIFAEVNNAHRTLTDSEDRDRYDARLQTDPSEISSVIDAESAFRRGRNLLDAGRNEGAHEQFKLAVDRSPEEEPEYRANLLYTEYLLIDKNDDGEPLDRERARSIYEELDAIESQFKNAKDWIHAYLGVVALGLGRRGEARELFREALSINSGNRLAQRQLRLIKMRSDKQNEGFFSKLLSKLNLT